MREVTAALIWFENKETPEGHAEISQSRQKCPALSSRGRSQVTHLALGELSEHGSQPIIIHITVSLNRHIEDVDGLLTGSLQGKGNVPHTEQITA